MLTNMGLNIHLRALQNKKCIYHKIQCLLFNGKAIWLRISYHNHVYHQPQFAKIPYPPYFKFQYKIYVLSLTRVSSTVMVCHELLEEFIEQTHSFLSLQHKIVLKRACYERKQHKADISHEKHWILQKSAQKSLSCFIRTQKIQISQTCIPQN